MIAMPVHGSAPKYEGQDKVNPSAMILSGRRMFDRLGWHDPSRLIRNGVEQTITSGIVTDDLKREMTEGRGVGTSRFVEEIIQNIETLAYAGG